MRETYLHYLWKTQSLFLSNSFLTKGESFNVLHPGKYNTESGPDFFDGIIEIDGIVWRGNIEIHVNASDWYSHRHQTDPNYDNVILHVVFNNDKPVFVHDLALPTLELKTLINDSHKIKFNTTKVLKNQISCASFIKEIDEIYLEGMKERVILNRLNRKIVFLLDQPFKNQDELQILYAFIFKAFGKKVNEGPFLKLAINLPYKILLQNDSKIMKHLLIGMSNLNLSGFDPSEWRFLKHKYQLVAIDKFQWKYKGLRPASFPEHILEKLIWFLETFNLLELNKQIKSKTVLSFLRKHLRIIKGDIFSESFFKHILINAIVPYVWWKGVRFSNEEYKNYAIDLLLTLNGEKNNILSKWSKIKIDAKKAYDSQALLEIYNEFCSANRCLECSVGTKILNN